MPVLQNVREERFASGVAKGMTNEEAYKFAGYKGLKTKDSSAHIRAKVNVKARIEELKARISKSATAQAAKRLSLTKELVLAELWDNAMLGRKVKGGSSARNRALELIGKHLGMFQDADASKPLRLEDLSTEDLKKLLEDDPKPQVQ